MKGLHTTILGLVMATGVLPSLAGILGQAAPATAAAAADPVLFWIQLAEKAGTVGICIWIIVWLQRRQEALTNQIAGMNKETTEVVKQNAQSYAGVRDAIERNTQVLERCARNSGGS